MDDRFQGVLSAPATSFMSAVAAKLRDDCMGGICTAP